MCLYAVVKLDLTLNVFRLPIYLGTISIWGCVAVILSTIFIPRFLAFIALQRKIPKPVRQFLLSTLARHALDGVSHI